MKQSGLIVALTALMSVFAAPLEDDVGVSLDKREACSDGQCVRYFSGQGCSGGELGNFKPDCTGACFQFSSFQSVFTGGTGIPIAGTACKIYSDGNCQNQILDIPDHIPFLCDSFGTAQSMQCFYNC